MTARAGAAHSIWHARMPRNTRDRAYVAYMATMVAFVAVVPVIRTVWVGLNSAEGIAILTASEAPDALTVIISGAWAACLLLGRARGPVVPSPFLSYALASSDVSRSAAFGSSMLRAAAPPIALLALAATLVSITVAGRGIVEPVSGMAFILAGVLAGVIAAVAWLAGQALPRASVLLAFGILLLGSLAGAWPAVQHVTPWGWVGLAYPTPASSASWETIAPLGLLTAALVCLVPALLNRLTTSGLTSQALRWESATTHLSSMDFAAAASVYRAQPRVGRRLRAIPPWTRRSSVFLIRDAVGAARTPGRLVAGTLALALAGALVSTAFSSGTSPWALGAVAGVVLFAGLGPLTDGIRHAANVASDLPLYGMTDERLLAHHVLFPLVLTAAVILLAAVTCSLLTGGALVPTALGALTLGMLTLAARIATALKGSLPPALLTPIPTPVGDLGAAARLVWALDGLVLAAMAGAAVTLASGSPALLVGTGVILAALVIRRWRHRA